MGKDDGRDDLFRICKAALYEQNAAMEGGTVMQGLHRVWP